MNNAKFIKLISLVAAIILVMGVLFTGCKPENDPPASGDPTEAPSDTAPASEEPTEEPTKEPTEEPTVAPTEIPSTEVITSEPVQTGEYRFDLIGEGQSLVCDLDSNGVDDIVSLFIQPDAGEYFRCTIFLAIELNGSMHSYTIEYDAYEYLAAVIDCDPNDNRLEVIVSCTHTSDDYTTKAFRVNAEGIIEEFSMDAHTMQEPFSSWFFDENPCWFNEGKLSMHMDTQILGTDCLAADYTITANGFELVSEGLLFRNDRNAIEVINDMPISIINADGTTTDATLEAGKTIKPIETDGKTYVRVVTSDGDEAFVYISFTENSIIPNIGDKEQHYYLEIHYEG